MNPAPKPPKSEPQSFSKLVETLQTLSSLIENQAIFTNAEFRLATIIVRRGGHRERVIVSAENWRAWTGLDERSREIALRGLRMKGISVDGRGDRAKLRFSIPEFQKFIETTSRTEKPKVQQRLKSAKAKPGMNIHPDCASGCQRLCESGKNCEIVPINSARAKVSETRSTAEQLGSPDFLPKPEANTCTPPDPRTDPAPSRQPSNPNTTKGVGVESEASRVDTEDGAIDGVAPKWPLTLKEMSSHFVTAGEVFLVKLLCRIRKKTPDVTDEELAEAIRLGTKKHQNSEMLWLLTVPDAVVNLRAATNKVVRQPAIPETAKDRAEREEFERWYAQTHPTI